MDSASSRAISRPGHTGLGATPLLKQNAGLWWPGCAPTGGLVPAGAQGRQPDLRCARPPHGTGGTGVPLNEPSAMGRGSRRRPKGSWRRSGRLCHWSQSPDICSNRHKAMATTHMSCPALNSARDRGNMYSPADGFFKMIN